MFIGLSKPEDLIEIRKLYQSAFEDTQAFVDYYFENKVKNDKVALIKEDDKLVAMMHLNAFVVKFNEQRYPISYFVAVATDQAYRNKGYMGKLMSYALKKLYADGETFSLLMPIDSRIYERYGFGFVEDHLKIECNTALFMVEKAMGQYKVASKDDIQVLTSIYDRYSRRFDLISYRNEDEFEKLWKELMTEQNQIILFDDGYIMIFYDHGVLSVREFVANKEQTFKEMLNYLQEVSNNGKVIIYDHISSPIKYFLPNIAENMLTLKPFMMARIINVMDFLIKNSQLFEDAVSIKLIDMDIEDNNRCFRIVDGKVDVISDEDYDVAMDVKTLTQLAFGYIGHDDIEQLSSVNHFKNKKAIIRVRRHKAHFFNEYV